MKRLVVLCAGALLLAASAQAATICVNSAGSGACKSSIQSAIDAASSGDTVVVRTGTYFENVVIPAGLNGLTLRGEGQNAILDPEDPYAAVPLTGTGISVFANNTTIQNLRIRNGDDHGIFVDSTAGGTIIRQVTISGSESDCIDSDGPRTQVLNSKLLGCGNSAIDIAAHDATVSNVIMENADSGCLEITGDRAVVRNSSCHVSEDNDCFSISGHKAEVVNNRADSCDGHAFDVDGDNWLVQRNRGNATDSDTFELDCTDCSSARASQNVAEDLGDDDSGFEYEGNGGTIEANRAEDIADQGVDISGDDNIVRRNQVKRIGGDSGEECFEIGGNNNTVERNVANICHGHGYVVFGDGNTLTSNRALESRESGFHVSSGTGNVLDRNTANNVNHFGFEVGASATDTELIRDNAGGSNRADLCDEGTGTHHSGSPQLKTKLSTPCSL